MVPVETPTRPPYRTADTSMLADPLLPSTDAAVVDDSPSGGWAPPAPPAPTSGSSAGPAPRRGRFAAGVLVGMALTATAAVGGYAIGADDDGSSATPPAATTPGTPAEPAEPPEPPARPVSVDSGEIADLVAAARPSVVLVRTEMEQAGPFGGISRGAGAGTGFVLSSDGFIVTNNHVVDNGTRITVTFADGSEEAATVVAADPSRDLAVVQVDRDDLRPLAVGDSDDLRLGDQLIAVGYALDLNGEPSVTAGILSAKERSITAPNGEQLVNLLQTDTAINPGNSGGPLLDGNGEVVGINTAIAGQAQNIGFAIAITPVLDVIDQLRAGDVPERALLGVTTAPSADPRGAEIVELAPGSGAADSDLQVGDVITAVDDRRVDDSLELGSAIATYLPGDTVTVTVERDGSSVDVTAVLGARS